MNESCMNESCRWGCSRTVKERQSRGDDCHREHRLRLQRHSHIHFRATATHRQHTVQHTLPHTLQHTHYLEWRERRRLVCIQLLGGGRGRGGPRFHLSHPDL